MRAIFFLMPVLFATIFYSPLSGSIKDNTIMVKDVIRIVQKWDLPKELREVSGISWIDATHIACVMDEQAIVFIFNLQTNSVEREIRFDGGGDYEGIAVAGKNIYTVRSNGIINILANYPTEKPSVKAYHTWIKKKNNSESLCYDKNSNRLLLILKGKDPHVKDGRGIYAFSLKNNKLPRKPEYTISFSDVNWTKIAGTFQMQPSDIAVHPQSGDLYILDGENPRLLIMDKKGNYKSMFELNKKDFNLPEGITFSSDGKLYISNEGKVAGRGNILQVQLP